MNIPRLIKIAGTVLELSFTPPATLYVAVEEYFRRIFTT